MTRLPFSLAALALFITAPFSEAGWSPDGATIKSTTALIKPMAGCSDGAGGTYVAWQELGILRAQHVLPTGDPDAQWPTDGVAACDVAADRSAIGTLPDGLGGFYVWWMEADRLFISRIGSDGLNAMGWASRGRELGRLPSTWRRPSVLRDAATGIHVAWVQYDELAADPQTVLIIHLGPNNTSADGLPVVPREIRAATATRTDEHWPQLAPAPDGGVFLAWCTYSMDPEVPSTWNLARLTDSGTSAAGWPPGGIDVAEASVWRIDDYFYGLPTASLVALAHDGRGGVFLWIEDSTGWDSGLPVMDRRLRRLQGDGSPAAGWTEEGTSIWWNFFRYFSGDTGPGGSLRAIFDGSDGVIIGAPTSYLHGPPSLDFVRWSDEGHGGSAGTIHGAGPSFYGTGPFETTQALPNERGGLFLGRCVPDGPYQQYEPFAGLSVDQCPAIPGWSGWSVEHEEIGPRRWYGDIALVESGDGGAIFFWSQRNERHGLFARRFGLHGQVTGVDPGGSDGRVALGAPRPSPFHGGTDAVIPVLLEHDDEFELALVDLVGREIARREPEWRTAGAHLVRWNPGALPAGVYFLRLRTGSGVAASRSWVVLR